jgi:hypothetical protein
VTVDGTVIVVVVGAALSDPRYGRGGLLLSIIFPFDARHVSISLVAYPPGWVTASTFDPFINLTGLTMWPKYFNDDE